MDYSLDYSGQRVAAEASADARASFIRRTYAHLAGAVLAFAALETLLVRNVSPEVLRAMFTGAGPIVLMVGFIGASWLANYWAQSGASPALQYAGLGLYVVVEAIIFLPLLYIASKYADDIIPKAGFMTLAMFGGLSFTVFSTKHDFSYLRSILSIGAFLALGLAVMSFFMGWNLGNFYSFAMVALASGFILYDTSNVLHHYRTDQHVAASLALFASVALLFYYIVRILLSNRR
jgi:FtsH-binding integral membrane protein